ncbi:MAG: DUF6414 family protein [Weissella hellenica]|uniref:DUF6414 family protein n=1 Tax=Weissella hellenica TaxID=46256 RepID=UPI003F9E2F88
MSKNIIYVDTELLNSEIAQLDGGIITKKTDSFGSNKTNQEENQTGAKIGGKVKVPVFEISSSIGGNDKTTTSVTKAESELYDTVFHDYSIDMLLDMLKDELKSDESQFHENDPVLVESAFKAYDFNQLMKITDDNLLDKLQKSFSASNKGDLTDINNQLKALKKAPNKDRTFIAMLEQKKKELDNPLKDVAHVFSAVNGFSKFVDTLYPDTVIFRTAESITLANKKDLRITPAQVSALSNASQSIHILGLVLTKQNDNLNNFGDFSADDIDKITGMLSSIMLSSFSILHQGDSIIQPIAIYFE